MSLYKIKKRNFKNKKQNLYYINIKDIKFDAYSRRFRIF